MATKQPNTPKTPRDVGPGYETRDAYIPGLLQFAFWMALLLAVTLIGMKYTFNYFKKAEPLGPMASPMLPDTYRMLPPSPRLQVHPHMELKDYCAVQQQEVNSYGWVDQQSGVVRIPIDRAMALVAERGLPARAASDAPSALVAAVPAIPVAAGGKDLEGQCGYVTEPPPYTGPSESGEGKK